MKIYRYLIALFFGCVSLGSLAAEREFRSIDEFLGTLPPTHRKEVSEGDLNGDKLSDRVVIDINTIPNQTSPEYEELKIYVFLQKQDGRFDLAQASKVGAVQVQYQFLRGIRIENGSFYVEFEGGLRPSWARYQFKLYKGKWRLVGVTGGAPDPYRTLKDEGEGVASSGSDFNLLTGDIAYISDEHTSQQQITRSKVAVRACFLADYDFGEEFIEKFCKK